MNTQTTTQDEILDLEKKYWDAMKNNDVEEAVSLTKFPCIIASAKGVQKIEEEEYRNLMQSLNGDTFKGIEIENPQVEFLNEDTALISYSVHFHGMDMLDVSTWVRENGKWTCAFHSENPVH